MTNQDAKEVITAYYNKIKDSLENERICEDAISRQAVLALATEECETAIIPYKRFVKGVNALPPFNPQPKTGHWMLWNTSSYDYTYKCDRCEDIVRYKSNYCPNCGAKMKGEAE